MDLLSIGETLSTWGHRGALRLAPAAKDLSRFDHLQSVRIGDVSFQVEEARPHKGVVLLKLSGIECIEEAEKLVGKTVFVDASAAIQTDQDEYFVHDLIGMKVFTDKGRFAGSIQDVMEGPAHDIYIVQGSFGEVLVPAVEEFILKVDPKANQMFIQDFPGLLEPLDPV